MIIEQENISTLLQDKKEDILLCFGCFDLLHIGHILYFEKLKAIKPIVCVGVFNDNLVALSKGAGRPILPENERVALLNALKNVDYTFIQKSGEVSSLLKKYNVDKSEYHIWENCIYPISLLKPAVVTVSSDFKLSAKMKEYCQDSNICLTVVEYSTENSTSRIIDKIKNSTKT